MDVVVHGVVDGHIHGAVVGHVLADQDLCHLWGIHVQHDWTWTRILEAAFVRINNVVIYDVDQIQLYFFFYVYNRKSNAAYPRKFIRSSRKAQWKSHFYRSKTKNTDNDIEPSGHNSTRPNEALFINIIPEELDILQEFCNKNNMPWRTPASNSKDQEIVTANKSISQELTLAIDMYNSSLPWIYRVIKFSNIWLW